VLAAFSVAAVTLGMVSAPMAQADPATCPPDCDTIPPAAWIAPAVIPLDAEYHWPTLSPLAVVQQRPRFYFEDQCAGSPTPNDPRAYAVAARATVTRPPGEWQLQAQVLHWRGDTWLGGQLADEVVRSAAAALRACQLTAPHVSPTVTTEEPGKLAAVLTVAGTPTTVVHQYLMAHPQSSSVVELAMWSTSPPADNWPAIPDGRMLDAMMAPLCEAYIASCR
jgi:hypothetical protein